MNTDTYAIMCGIIVIGVRAIVEAKRPASFLKKLILVFFLCSFTYSIIAGSANNLS